VRSSLAGLKPKGLGPRDPALAIAYGFTTDTNATTTYAPLTVGTLLAGDGFELSANALTCYVPGIYELTVDLSPHLNAGTLGYIGYQINGGAVIDMAAITNATFQHALIQTLVKLGAGDTISVGFRGNGGADSIQVIGTRVSLVQISSFQ
jgi:hypothetical protein